MKEAGRELAAFLLAVEQTQGARHVEAAGRLWLNALMNQPQSICSSTSSFRRVTVEAARALPPALDESAPETAANPETPVASWGRQVCEKLGRQISGWRRTRVRNTPESGYQFLEETPASSL